MSKDRAVQFRVSAVDLSRIVERADAEDRTVAAWVRGVVLREVSSARPPAQEPIAETKKRPAPPPYTDILNLWREILPELPQPLDVDQWTDARKAAMRARWHDELPSLDDWAQMMRYVKRSPFLTGKVDSPGRKPFRADIDWLLKPANLLKLSEGKYHG